MKYGVGFSPSPHEEWNWISLHVQAGIKAFPLAAGTNVVHPGHAYVLPFNPIVYVGEHPATEDWGLGSYSILTETAFKWERSITFVFAANLMPFSSMPLFFLQRFFFKKEQFCFWTAGWNVMTSQSFRLLTLLLPWPKRFFLSDSGLREHHFGYQPERLHVTSKREAIDFYKEGKMNFH